MTKYEYNDFNYYTSDPEMSLTKLEELGDKGWSVVTTLSTGESLVCLLLMRKVEW